MMRERFQAKQDPPMRKNHTCVVCRKPLPQIAVMHGDPFCSTDCSRTWHRADRESR